MKHRHFLPLVALSLSASACGETPVAIGDGPGQDERAIIGGAAAVESDYPAVGSLLFKATSTYYGDMAGMLCTGSSPPTWSCSLHTASTPPPSLGRA